MPYILDIPTLIVKYYELKLRQFTKIICMQLYKK